MNDPCIHTPVEKYHHASGIDIYVKREDMCAPVGAPSFSKMRGVYQYISKLKGSCEGVGVLDTYHSQAGWAVAWVCKQLNLYCMDFYPQYKHDPDMRYPQKMAAELGAQLIPLQAGRSCILYHQAKKLAGMFGYPMMPNALKLYESIDATAKEVVASPELPVYGTLVVSASSGTIAKGVLIGLIATRQVDLVVHMGYSRSQDALRKYLTEGIALAQLHGTSIRLVDESYSYKDKVDFPCPFPSNPYYDLKAWKWLSQHVVELAQPVTFWNIGA